MIHKNRFDKSCHQWLAFEIQDVSKEEIPVGVARLIFKTISDPLNDGAKEIVGKIGRVAVLKDYRGRGIAKSIILAIEQYIVTTEPKVLRANLHAQIDKADFYKKLGYQVVNPDSPPFLEEGILHVKMEKILAQSCTSESTVLKI